MDVNKVDERGRVALFFCKSLEITRFFVDNGADVNILDSWGNTAVVSLYGKRNSDIIKYLAEITNIDLEDRKNYSSTLLERMISNQN